MIRNVGIIAGIIFTVCLLCGCANDFEGDHDIWTDTEENISERYSEEENIGNGFSVSTALDVYSASDGGTDYVKMEPRHADINSGINKFKIFTNYSAKNADGWDNINVRIVAICNGGLIDISLDGENYAESYDVNINMYETLEQEIMLSSDDILYSHGYITIMCMYNPEGIPEKGPYQYDGCITYTFEYDYADGKEYVFKGTENGEYIDVPDNEIDYAYGIEVGYKQEENKYTLDFSYMYNDIEISADESLCIKINLGVNYDVGNYYVGVICDGKFIKLDEDDEFIGINMDSGNRLFQYEIPKEKNDNVMEFVEICSNRFRVNIR